MAALSLVELAAHRAGECDRDCRRCAEAIALHTELVRLYTARRPDCDRIDAIEDRLHAIGEASWIADADRLAAADAAHDAAVCR